MDRRAAEEILPMLINAAQSAADTLEVWKKYHPTKPAKPFSAAVGEIVFAIDNVIRPIITEHPDLDPGING